MGTNSEFNFIDLKKTLFSLLLLALTSLSSAQQEGDRIIAIIGNDIISESDLNAQLYLYAKQNNIPQLTEQAVRQVFQNMLAEKLMLAKAEQDSIIVTDEEAQKQVDFRVQQMVQQFGSEKNLEEAYGMTMIRIRSYLKEELKKRMKIDRLKAKKFGSGITITRTEVLKFYDDYKDSLPPVPETFELYQIVRFPRLSEEAKKAAYTRAKSFLDSIKVGADFSELARMYSDDSASAVHGGDLGKVKKGMLVKEFEDAAYLLKPGEVSDVVETQYGYHIIKLNEKSGEIIRVQHILVKFPQLESADFDAIAVLNDIRAKTNGNEKTFKELAALHSQDKQLAADSGYVGKLNIAQLDSAEIIALKELGKNNVSEPVRVGDERDYSYSIFFVKDRFPEHKANIEGDYHLIETIALNHKENKILSEWLEELKKDIYVEVKI
jgi:peptidyl-prolyl cis-trans isomerase SurA